MLESVLPVPSAGQVSVITELLGAPPPGMGMAEKHRTVHIYIPRPPSPMQAWKEVGLRPHQVMWLGFRGCRDGAGGTGGEGGVGVGGLG